MALREIVDRCIEQLELDFMATPFAFYTEQSAQSYLYHLLTAAGLDQLYPTFGGEGHLMRELQVEYPPVEGSGGRRGQYDLVVFDRAGIDSINWWNHRRDVGDCQLPIAPAVAIELGLNKGLRGTERAQVEVRDIPKEMERLGTQHNGVGYGLLVYLYGYEVQQLPSLRQITDIVVQASKNFHGPVARITAVRFNHRRRSEPPLTYRLRVLDGEVVERGNLG